MMDKMREEFEAWISQFSGQSAIRRRAAWNVWKASRSAMCVELGSLVFSQDKNGEGGLMLPERVFKAMDDAGVSYK